MRAPITPAREIWRHRKADLLGELAANGEAWDVQSGHRFELQLQIEYGVPTCRVVCGEEILACGYLS